MAGKKQKRGKTGIKPAELIEKAKACFGAAQISRCGSGKHRILLESTKGWNVAVFKGELVRDVAFRKCFPDQKSRQPNGQKTKACDCILVVDANGELFVVLVELESEQFNAESAAEQIAQRTRLVQQLMKSVGYDFEQICWIVVGLAKFLEERWLENIKSRSFSQDNQKKVGHHPWYATATLRRNKRRQSKIEGAGNKGRGKMTL